MEIIINQTFSYDKKKENCYIPYGIDQVRHMIYQLCFSVKCKSTNTRFRADKCLLVLYLF